MAAAPGPKSPFDNLPKAVAEEVSTFLPAEDIAALSLVSKNVFKNISENPSLWTRVAKKLNVEVKHIQDPKQDVLAYYKESNDKMLQFFAKKGFKIQKVADPFLQRRIIENYVKGRGIDESLFHHAIAQNELEVVKLFIETKVPMDKDCMKAAIRRNNPEIAKLLIEAKVPLSESIMHEAAVKGCTEIVKLLIDAKTPINEACLYWAALNGHIETVKLLIEAKAPFNADYIQDIEESGQPEMVALLREAYGK